MTEIWIVQYLCPARHCVVAIAYEPSIHSAAEVEAMLVSEMQRLGVAAQCGICQSTELHFEHGRTKFTDWDTARRELAVTQAENIKTRAAIERLRSAP